RPGAAASKNHSPIRHHRLASSLFTQNRHQSIMNKKLLSLYSLKFNPFSPEIPTAALWASPALESFCWRIEQQIGEGGFALTLGDPGTGKSAALRILCERLNHGRDLCVGILTRPQAFLADFYRELGELFAVPLSPHNRWNSAKVLRECLNHLLKAAGNPRLLTASLIQTLCEHAAGNLRLLMNMANDLLAAACHQEREQIDEKLYFEVFALDPKPSKKS